MSSASASGRDRAASAGVSSSLTISARRQSTQADDLERALKHRIKGDVRFDRHDRMLYATDASLYQVAPIGVVIPESIEDAETAVRLCAERGLAILPRGGGTSLAGQAVADAVVVDFSAKCTSVGEVDTAHRSVHVEPGVVLDQLNNELSRRGEALIFGPDVATASHANIGGMIGNNSAGARSIVYGRTVDRLRAVDAMLLRAGGRTHRTWLRPGAAMRDPVVREVSERVIEVVRRHATLIRERFPKILRHVDGYNLDLLLDQIERDGDALENLNLASLVCGSEGTLAVTLGAELALDPRPIKRSLCLLAYASVDEALAQVNPILTTKPSAVELLDDVVLDLAAGNMEQSANLQVLPTVDGELPKAVLYVEHQAIHDLSEIDAAHGALRDVVGDTPLRKLETEEESGRAWRLRKAGEPLLHGLPGRRKPLSFVEDTAVSPERLPEFVKRFREIVRRHGARAAYFAHASVGCLHIRPMLDLGDSLDRARMIRIAEEITDLVCEFDGALSGEHGDGRVRSPLLERYFGPALMRAFREIKDIFDPDNLLNPGNIVGDNSAASIVTNTRSEEESDSGVSMMTDTYFDYSDQHDFKGAVNMCNGAGVCRRQTGGTMCPSYRATLDERHATRGRGNALRLAISGQLLEPGEAPESKWNDAATLETLDLCLSCKACKAECPSNVDMARLKAEYHGQRHRHMGRAPVRARVFGEARLALSLGSKAPWLANAIGASGLGRRLMNRIAGLAPERSLPPAARSLYRAWPKLTRGQDQGQPAVILFADCFSTFSETSIGVSAARLLQTFGYRVLLPKTGCCARPMISQGLMDRALDVADSTAGALLQALDESGAESILVTEPSCLSAIIDDWPQLRMSTSHEDRMRLAQRTMLVEDFLERDWDRHPDRPVAPTDQREVFIHRHCHQKALQPQWSTNALLSRLSGGGARELETGCCGMAGAFGFTDDHFDLSMKIAELDLAPALRGASPEAMIVAGGASCRHQIRDLLAMEALHPVEAALQLIEEGGVS